MRKMTFEEYDKLCERVNDNGYPCLDWWPSPDSIETHIGNAIPQNIDFLTWVLETNEPPETRSEKESKSYINKLLRDNLILYDPAEVLA